MATKKYENSPRDAIMLLAGKARELLLHLEGLSNLYMYDDIGTGKVLGEMCQLHLDTKEAKAALPKPPNMGDSTTNKVNKAN